MLNIAEEVNRAIEKLQVENVAKGLTPYPPGTEVAFLFPVKSKGVSKEWINLDDIHIVYLDNPMYTIRDEDGNILYNLRDSEYIPCRICGKLRAEAHKGGNGYN